MALSVCRLLMKLAHEQGKTIISTIHQPSSQAFSYFDRLLLMADGNIVYQGIANKAPLYFKTIGFEFGKYANPADIFMKVLSINYPKREEDIKKLELLTVNYNTTKSAIVNIEIKTIKLPETDFISQVRTIPPKLIQFEQLWRRNALSVIRSNQVLFSSFGISAFDGLLMIALFYKQFYHFPQVDKSELEHRDAKDQITIEILNSVGAMFCLIMMVLLASSYQVMLTFQVEKPVFLRENSA